MAVFDLTKASFAQLLAYVNAQYSKWQDEQEIISQRKNDIAKLHTMRLSVGERAVHAFEIYRESLKREARKRIKLYAAVADDSGNPEMLTKKRLDEYQDQIMTRVRGACQALKEIIERDAAATGNWSPAAMPNPYRYVDLEADILDVVNANLRVPRSRGSILANAEPSGNTPTQQKPLRRRQGRRNPDLQRLKSRVKKLCEQGLTHREICEKLGNSLRPPRVEWRELSWPIAYKRKTSSVAKWLSVACK